MDCKMSKSCPRSLYLGIWGDLGHS